MSVDRLKLIGFGILIGLLCSALILVVANPRQVQSGIILPTQISTEITVFVTGEVNSPGTYSLPPSSRIQDAIKLAGGWTAQADQTALNLASILIDGQGIYVPAIGEDPPRDPSIDRFTPVVSGGKIDINTATVEMLDNLPGIGPSKAEQIIAYRQNNGVFDTIEDILKVPGIGPSIFEQIQDLITVSPTP